MRTPKQWDILEMKGKTVKTLKLSERVRREWRRDPESGRLDQRFLVQLRAPKRKSKESPRP